MRWSAALLFLVACAQTPPGQAPCPPAQSDEPEAREAGAEVVPVTAALAASGHRCAASKDDPGVTVCEPDTPGLVPFVVVQSPPMALFAAYFEHRAGVTCPELAPILNELNAKADGIKVVCEKENVTFTTSFILPSRGFTEAEIAAQARRFQGLIQLMLREEGLRAQLE